MTTDLDEERDRLRAAIGRYGIWRNGNALDPAYVTEAERLGFGSLWVGGSPADDLAQVESLIEATEHIVVATGIVNIWTADPVTVAASWRRIEAAHPGRFILGIGAGHPERHSAASRPYSSLVEYLDVLDSEGVPSTRLALAALGDRVLGLAGERTLGAHPYFVPPEHSSRARSVLGPAPLLVPEQRLTLEADPARARDILRPTMKYYFELTNYVGNLIRLGVDESEIAAETDAVIDRIAVWGEPDQVRAGLDAHLDAGADHVLAQIVTPEGRDPLDELRSLAAVLGLSA